jgi:hypothetical protein
MQFISIDRFIQVAGHMGSRCGAASIPDNEDMPVILVCSLQNGDQLGDLIERERIQTAFQTIQISPCKIHFMNTIV